MAISITKKTSTTNTTSSSGRSIKYIVMHYTAGTSSSAGKAASVAAYFAKSSTKASADFIVDNSTIVQFNPDIENRYTWHCGGSKVSSKGGSYYGKATNKNSIGVEICSTNSTGTVKSANDSTWSFTTAALAKATEIVQYLMETYDIDSDHVIRHYDVTGKLCPGIVGWNADSGSESKWKSWKSGLTESNSTTTSTTASSSTSSSASSTSSSKTTSSSSTITVDGVWGKKTTTALQKILGTTQDGIISNQRSKYKSYLTAIDTASWKFATSGSSACIKALQKKIGATADGIAGPATVKKLQKFVGTTQDSIMGTKTVTALQKWINKQ